ncbi:MAG: trigger factor [Candidatus Bipolaricaulota bacterium]|nr:MAG: trigger factor [Candidatus Bipolaricaulota bacterium]
MTSPEPNYEITARRDTEVDVRVTVPREVVRAAVEAVYARYARGARVPGFRRGRIPREYLESRFGTEQFAAEARADLHEELFRKAVRELDLRPVAAPTIAPGSWSAESEYAFDVTLSVLPRIEAPPVDGIEIRVEELPSITEQNVQQALEQVRWEFGKLIDKARDARIAEGDVVRLRCDDNEGQLRVDAADPLGAALMGKAIGDPITLPEEGQAEEESGNVEILAIAEAQLPSLDDELARDAGHPSLDALREHIESALRAARDGRLRELRRAKLLETLVGRSAIPLPETLTEELVAQEIDEIREQLASQSSPQSLEAALASQGESLEALADRLRASVETRIRRDLLLDVLIRDGGHLLDDARLEEEVRAEAEAAGENPLRTVAQIKAEGRWEELRRARAIAETLDELLERVTVIEVVKEEK